MKGRRAKREGFFGDQRQREETEERQRRDERETEE
jgi:hypothetical protein